MILPDPDGGPRVDTVAFFNAPAETLALNTQEGSRWRRPISNPGWAGADAMLSELDAPSGSGVCAWVPIGPDWCVLFTNAPLGNDVGFRPQSAAGRGILSVYACISTGSARSSPARHFAVYFPSPSQDLFDVAMRGLECYADGDRWHFAQYGEPLPFEDLDAYRARRKRDRLTGDMVYRYLAAMGVPYDVEPTWSEAAVVTFRGLWRLPW